MLKGIIPISVSPTIDLKPFNPKIKQSEPIRLEALISAEPIPEVTVSHNGKVIGGLPCTSIEKGLCRVEYIKNSYGINDGGLYQIIATNECGSATVEAKILVVRKYIYIIYWNNTVYLYIFMKRRFNFHILIQYSTLKFIHNMWTVSIV